MFCESCGQQLNQKAKFCPRCGKKIKTVPQEKRVPDKENNISLTKELGFKSKSTSKENVTEETSGHNGLGGWLTLVGVGLILSILFSVVDIWISWGSVVDVLIDSMFLLFSLWLCYLFFSKKKIFPKAFISFLAINALLSIIGIILLDENSRQKISGEFGRSILVAVIWIPYMVISKQVKATFVK